MQSLESLLPAVLQEIAHDPERSLIFLQELWPQIVGSSVARNVRPVRLRGRVLTCRAADKHWNSQMETMGPLLVRTVNQFWASRLIDRIEWQFHLSEPKG